MKINGAVAGDHRDPGSKRRCIAQRVQLFVSVKKDVLYEIVNFGPGHSRQQNAVYEWRIKIVETSESVSVTV